MRVSLIYKPDSKVTGLRRYSDSLIQYLKSQNIGVQLNTPTAPVPKIGMHIGQRLGWDLKTFFESYPVSARVDSADLYHLTSETLASLLTFKSLKPAVVTVHAFFTYVLRNDPSLATYNHAVHKMFDRFAAHGLHRAQAIIAVSEYVKRILVEHLGIDDTKIYVVPEAVDHTVFRPIEAPELFRTKYGLNDGKQIILYVGSEQPRKNFLTLIRAFARLKQRVGNVRLLKVGQPEMQDERQKALSLIKKLGIEDQVTFLSHAGDELPLIYNAADVFVFPSLYEGFGFPPLEAMACGTPVICSNTTSLPEVVGDAALLFDPMDEDRLVNLMERLLLDRQERDAYSRRGLQNARNFSWTETARQTVKVYQHVVEKTI
jgi:glycosyltransferase involved in cell wall biosynthesis